jgi:hypothetical protein
VAGTYSPLILGYKLEWIHPELIDRLSSTSADSNGKGIVGHEYPGKQGKSDEL